MSFELVLPNQRQPELATPSTHLEVVMPPVKQWLEARRAAVNPSAGPSPTSPGPSAP